MGIDQLNIEVDNGKYTVIQDQWGNLRAERYHLPWRDCCGDGLILALAQEVKMLRIQLTHIKQVSEASRKPEAV